VDSKLGLNPRKRQPETLTLAGNWRLARHPAGRPPWGGGVAGHGARTTSRTRGRSGRKYAKNGFTTIKQEEKMKGSRGETEEMEQEKDHLFHAILSRLQ